MFVVKELNYGCPIGHAHTYSVWLENDNGQAWIENFPASHCGGENSAKELAYKLADKLNSGEITEIKQYGWFQNISDFIDKLSQLKPCCMTDCVSLNCRGCGVYDIGGNVGAAFAFIFFDDNLAIKAKEALNVWSKKNKVKFTYRTIEEYKICTSPNLD